MIELDLHVGWFVLGGFALLAMTILPERFRDSPLSLPICYVAAGWGIFEAFDALRGPIPLASPLDGAIVQYVTELIVIVSLVGAGLKLDRSLGLVSWGAVWRLLSIGMFATVAVAAGMGLALGLGVAAALLLGAVIAPTDPVLADDVQVEEPGEDGGEVRFTLTAEAGLNDGLAFPLVYLAVAIAAADGSWTSVVGEWLAVDVVYRVAVGVAAGWLLGRGMIWFSHTTGQEDEARPSAGLFVLGSTILVYGLTELVNGYGFLAVFVAALTRDAGGLRQHVSAFADELESMLLAFVLLGFGALLSEGILDALTWPGALVGLALVLVVRPLAGLLALVGSPMLRRERVAVAFFGIRGMGSLYYLAWASNKGNFDTSELASVWAIVAFTILTSVVVHGLTATRVMAHVERVDRDLSHG